jgi:hypothetical protein
MNRNKEKYPKIVKFHSMGHYPSRYTQVTDSEFKKLKKIGNKYYGGLYPHFKKIFDDESRIIPQDAVDVLPKEIPEYCEYC